MWWFKLIVLYLSTVYHTGLLIVKEVLCKPFLYSFINFNTLFKPLYAAHSQVCAAPTFTFDTSHVHPPEKFSSPGVKCGSLTRPAWAKSSWTAVLQAPLQLDGHTRLRTSVTGESSLGDTPFWPSASLMSCSMVCWGRQQQGNGINKGPSDVELWTLRIDHFRETYQHYRQRIKTVDVPTVRPNHKKNLNLYQKAAGWEAATLWFTYRVYSVAISAGSFAQSSWLHSTS